MLVFSFLCTRRLAGNDCCRWPHSSTGASGVWCVEEGLESQLVRSFWKSSLSGIASPASSSPQGAPPLLQHSSADGKVILEKYRKVAQFYFGRMELKEAFFHCKGKRAVMHRLSAWLARVNRRTVATRLQTSAAAERTMRLLSGATQSSRTGGRLTTSSCRQACAAKSCKRRASFRSVGSHLGCLRRFCSSWRSRTAAVAAAAGGGMVTTNMPWSVSPKRLST